MYALLTHEGRRGPIAQVPLCYPPRECPLPGHAVLRCLSADSVRALQDACQRTNYPAGGILFSEGHPASGVYIVLSGRIKLAAA